MSVFPPPAFSSIDMIRLNHVRRPAGEIGHIVYRFPEVDSTNRVIADLGQAGARAGTVVVADHQTAGHGKGDRFWFSRPGGGLCLSLLLRPSRPLEEIFQVTLVLAVAAVEAIVRVSGVNVQVKWPNDLLVGGRKLCGILSELVLTPENEMAYVLSGIGINVNLTEEDFPDVLKDVGTSLQMEAGRPIDRFALFSELLNEFDRWVKTWEREGFGPVREAWARHSCTLGRVVSLESGKTRCQGVAVDLGDDGSLSVRDESGNIHRFYQGETRLLAA